MKTKNQTGKNLRGQRTSSSAAWLLSQPSAGLHMRSESKGRGVECLTRPDLAKVLQVSLRTVDRMIADGEIPVRRVRGKIVRFLYEDVEDYLKGRFRRSSSFAPSAMEDRYLAPGIRAVRST
jgi:excisionase family DNA binding protein